MNRVNLIGRLTKDIDIRVSQNDIKVGSFTVAVNRTFKNSQGEYEADFIRCTAFRSQAEILEQYTRKGSQVGISGRIQTRNYENNNGERVYVTEVIVDSVDLLEPKNDNNQQGYNNQQQQNNSNQQAYGNQNQQNYGNQNYNNKQGYGNQNGQYEHNPFSNSKGPVDIDDSDLPF